MPTYLTFDFADPLAGVSGSREWPNRPRAWRWTERSAGFIQGAGTHRSKAACVLLLYRLPLLLPGMTTARVETIHAEPGSLLGLGGKLADLRVDLSTTVAHDCPPVTFYRLVLREKAWLRRLALAPGQMVAVGEAFAWFTTSAEETVDGEPARPPRIAAAAILQQAGWWSGGEA
jgi:hypothetical protein